jgi:hypothetical protein
LFFKTTHWCISWWINKTDCYKEEMSRGNLSCRPHHNSTVDKHYFLHKKLENINRYELYCYRKCTVLPSCSRSIPIPIFTYLASPAHLSLWNRLAWPPCFYCILHKNISYTAVRICFKSVVHFRTQRKCLTCITNFHYKLILLIVENCNYGVWVPPTRQCSFKILCQSVV